VRGDVVHIHLIARSSLYLCVSPLLMSLNVSFVLVGTQDRSVVVIRVYAHEQRGSVRVRHGLLAAALRSDALCSLLHKVAALLLVARLVGYTILYCLRASLYSVMVCSSSSAPHFLIVKARGHLRRRSVILS